MKNTAIALSAACAASLVLAGCTPQARPAPTTTVTVTETVTASPTPAASPAPDAGAVADDAYAAPTMSSADAITECVAAHDRADVDSTLTGETYAFLTRGGAWWVVMEGENENGPLYGDCTVRGDDQEVGYGESVVDAFTPDLVDTVVNEKGGL
ncbi:hypothetical protein [Microbacterium oleivorans]|uniref:hypothetical protein n=1 Tax=Microbacterium oleivorans TaxID=273677 RepID=UPI00203CF0A2|nr:hypothetical protein [Microbacterium oleivorans]MCM3696026.1 hypothetical protein [Microbacterium oleivorans]